jgi:hypothetical protein
VEMDSTLKYRYLPTVLQVEIVLNSENYRWEKLLQTLYRL